MKNLVLTFISIFIFPRLGFPASNAPTASPIDIKKIVLTEEIAKDAYLWGYPLVRFERTRKLLTTTPGFGHAPLNSFYHASRLPTPTDKGILNPLPDALYSSAFLDLRNHPMVLETPAIKNRFYSLQILDAFANNITFISSRTRGEAAGKFFITGPHFTGPTPQGFERIHASTNFVWIVGHIAAHSPAHAKTASHYLGNYKLRPYNSYLRKEKMPKPRSLTAKLNPSNDPRKLADAGIRYYDELGMGLLENDPSLLDTALLGRFRTIHIGPGLITSQHINAREIREAYERAIALGEIDIDRVTKKNLIQNRNGWNFVIPSGDFSNYSNIRAAASKIYFAESSAAESVHPVIYVDSSNMRLNGNFTYILHFNKGKIPPVGAFWSVAAYDAQQRNLPKNDLNRYALGSYSKNLIQNSDGSLDLYISANEPTGHLDNWLPAPRGNFYIMMNLYNPTDDIISGKYTLPGLLKQTSFQISEMTPL